MLLSASEPALRPSLTRERFLSTINAIRDFDNTGIGLMEISHRTPGWERIMAETRQLWRDLLNIPDTYEVLFLGGGASTQFYMVPANLMKTKAAYLQTGVWAKKAMKEAKNFGQVEVVASSEDKTYNYLPKGWTVPADADYFHITTNNTIYGTEQALQDDCPAELLLGEQHCPGEGPSTPVELEGVCEVLCGASS